MTTDSTTDQYTFATILDVDPEINYFPWRLKVDDVAAGAATLTEPTGLFTVVTNDANWRAYPENIVTDNGEPTNGGQASTYRKRHDRPYDRDSPIRK
jgi:hypothetical protein